MRPALISLGHCRLQSSGWGARRGASQHKWHVTAGPAGSPNLLAPQCANHWALGKTARNISQKMGCGQSSTHPKSFSMVNSNCRAACRRAWRQGAQPAWCHTSRLLQADLSEGPRQNGTPTSRHRFHFWAPLLWEIHSVSKYVHPLLVLRLPSSEEGFC